jgi:formamidopyrimidine-DNA glycosylase
MPEGVEVRIFSEGLQKEIVNYSVEEVTVLAGKYTKNSPSGLEASTADLPAIITNINNKGKFLWWELTGRCHKWYILSTLGLTGAWTMMETPYNKIRIKTVYTINKVRVTKDLYLFDIRNFATIKFTPNVKDLQEKLTLLGADMFSRSWTCDKFDDVVSQALEKSGNITISEMLLSQKWIAGPGTYIISEALYAAKISPLRKLDNVTKKEACKILDCIRTVANNSYKAQTFSVRNLTQDISVLNKYQFAIYGKNKDTLGNPIKRSTVVGRTIKWVPKIQT